MSQMTYLNGLAAEEIAERYYIARGYSLVKKRWRSKAGEIDLIVEKEGLIVFVEVKARKTHEAAAHAITPTQWARIMTSAEIFVSEEGYPPSTDLRFDAALIDRSGMCEIIENAPIL